MKMDAKHASFLPALLDALQHTEGPVLELGAGLHSTFALHWLCLHQGRSLVTYEHKRKWYDVVRHCQAGWHDVRLVPDWDWDRAEIEQPWAVALVDHGPAERRKVEIARLADWAQAIVVHDVEWRQNRHYGYDLTWAEFEYVKRYGLNKRVTVILSNCVDVTRWGHE